MKEGEEQSSDNTAADEYTTSDEYLDNDTIAHRIVSIEADGIHTRGDNNDYNDGHPVTAENYVAKLIWWNNYLGWPFKIMYEKNGFFWLMGAAAVLALGLVLTKTKKPE